MSMRMVTRLGKNSKNWYNIYMTSKKLIFISFVFLSLVMVGYLLYGSAFFRSDKADAGSFGISPPFVNAGEIWPGESHTQRITLLRGRPGNSELINAKINAPEFESWLKIDPEIIVFPKEQDRITINVTLAVPADAYSGKYRGDIIIGMQPKGPASGVGIALGAHVNVSFEVVDGNERPKEIEIFEAANNELYRRTAGKIMIVVDDFGKPYYVHKEDRKVVGLNNYKALETYIKKSAKGISNNDLWKMPLALAESNGKDTDEDGLDDEYEKAIGTNMYFSDSDDDGLSDRDEIEAGFTPVYNNSVSEVDKDFAFRQSGNFFVAVENGGEIWFVAPRDNKRYLISNEANLLYMIRSTGLGISKSNLDGLLSGVE